MANLLNIQPVRYSVSNKLILIFIDGVGVGELNPSYNPCCFSETGIFNCKGSDLPFDGIQHPLDAQLGVPGYPQSATGHTTIYTGINAPAHINKHLYGFPNAELRSVLQDKSLFVILTRREFKCKFMNAFRPVFFTSPELFKNKHLSATTEMNKYAGLSFADFSQIMNKRALYHDYSNKELISKGFDLPSFSADQAAEIITGESQLFDVVLYEYFMTDFAGHARDMKQAMKEIHKVENLVLATINKTNFDNTSLMVVSDHGNIEDLRTKSHTNNPAFFGVWWAKSFKGKSTPKSLEDVCPLILSMFQKFFPDI